MATESKKQYVCTPGQRLCLSDENTIAGQGTFERQGYIYSMLAGVVVIKEKDKVCTSSNRPCIELTEINLQSKFIEIKSFGNQTIVPVAGDIVTARITVVNQRFAKCVILCIGDVPLKRAYRYYRCYIINICIISVSIV